MATDPKAINESIEGKASAGPKARHGRSLPQDDPGGKPVGDGMVHHLENSGLGNRMPQAVNKTTRRPPHHHGKSLVIHDPGFRIHDIARKHDAENDEDRHRAHVDQHLHGRQEFRSPG